MTVCDLCKGTGKLLKPWYDTTGAMKHLTGDVCFMCDGKGTVGEPMTNEEWLRQASTEDVAKWLSKISKFFHECGKRDVYPKTMYEEDWECWLKEIHNG